MNGSSVKCGTCVRQVCFSKDSKTVVAVCDNATIWIWNRESEEGSDFESESVLSESTSIRSSPVQSLLPLVKEEVPFLSNLPNTVDQRNEHKNGSNLRKFVIDKSTHPKHQRRSDDVKLTFGRKRDKLEGEGQRVNDENNR